MRCEVRSPLPSLELKAIDRSQESRKGVSYILRNPRTAFSMAIAHEATTEFEPVNEGCVDLSLPITR
jgi:hypothetical protein